MNNVFDYSLRYLSVQYIFQHKLTFITTPPPLKKSLIRACYLLLTFFIKLNNDWKNMFLLYSLTFDWKKIVDLYHSKMF